MDTLISILIVEDHPESLYACTAVLQQEGWQIEQATSGTEALKILLQREVTLILLDVKLPDMNGFDLMQRIRERPQTRKIPVIFITGEYRSEKFVQYGFELGGYDYILKPIDGLTLRNKVSVFVNLYLQNLELRRLYEQLRNEERIERELRAQQERFLAILDNFPELVAVTDINTYEVLFVNAVFEREIGGNPVGGLCYCGLYGREYPCEFCAEAPRTIGGPPHVWEYYHARSQRYFMITSQLIKWPDGRDVRIEVAIDITQRKQAEEERQRALLDLQRSNRELEQFAYIVSHDLQEPLRRMKNFATLLRDRYGGQLDEKADGFLDHITGGAERMQRLIGDLLRLSRVSTREQALETVDSQALVAQLLVQFEDTIAQEGAGITIDSLPIVRADAGQMGQLFQNLLLNAIKFRSEKAPSIHIAARKEDAEWIFSVRDNGIGIAPNAHERIFTMFQRLHTDDSYPGTGIGLAICKKIVVRHGGRIWVESVPQEGTTFFFTIPEQNALESEDHSSGATLKEAKAS